MRDYLRSSDRCRRVRFVECGGLFHTGMQVSGPRDPWSVCECSPGAGTLGGLLEPVARRLPLRGRLSFSVSLLWSRECVILIQDLLSCCLLDPTLTDFCDGTRFFSRLCAVYGRSLRRNSSIEGCQSRTTVRNLEGRTVHYEGSTIHLKHRGGVVRRGPSCWTHRIWISTSTAKRGVSLRR